jgi:hypothetical protein
LRCAAARCSAPHVSRATAPEPPWPPSVHSPRMAPTTIGLSPPPSLPFPLPLPVLYCSFVPPSQPLAPLLGGHLTAPPHYSAAYGRACLRVGRAPAGDLEREPRDLRADALQKVLAHLRRKNKDLIRLEPPEGGGGSEREGLRERERRETADGSSMKISSTASVGFSCCCARKGLRVQPSLCMIT